MLVQRSLYSEDVIKLKSMFTSFNSNMTNEVLHFLNWKSSFSTS